MSYNKSLDCEGLHHHLELQNQKLEWLKRDLHIENKGSRSRRGLLGTVLTAVFGVNDEVYKDINTLDNNQKELIKSSHRQSELMLAAGYSVNETQHYMEKQLAKYNSQLQALNQRMNSTAFVVHMLNMYQQGLNIISETIDQYGKLTRVQFNRGNFFDIVSPAQVASAIEEASELLSGENEIKIYALIKTEVKQNLTHIIIFGYFPIVDKLGYDIIKFTEIPVIVTNTSYTTFKAPRTYTAINYDQQLMFDLSPEDFAQCLNLQNDTFACAPTAIQKLGTTRNCIIESMYGSLEPCRPQLNSFKLNHIIWKKLMVPNSWLFITPAITSVGIVCHKSRVNAPLAGTGILRLDTGCRIDAKQHLLFSNQMTEVEVKGAYIHPLPISWKQNTESPSPMPTETIYHPSNNLEIIISQEKELIQHQDNELWNTVPEHHATALLSSGLLGVLLVVSIVAILTWVKIRKVQHPASPPTDTGVQMDDI